MDIKQYIETGILDNYVLGLVTERERAEVEQYAQQYPEIKQDLDAIENALANYAQLHEVAPPAHLKAKVLQEIESLDMKAASSVAAVPKRTNSKQGVLGLLGLLFLLSAGAAFYFYNQNQVTEQTLSERILVLEDEKDNCDSLRNDLERQNQGLIDLINFINHDATEVTKMNSTGDDGKPIAEVYWNPDAQKAFVDIGTLPPLPEGKQYQLWGFVDGKPTSMDMIDLKAQTGRLSPVRYIPDAKIYAVSIEPAGLEQVGPTGAVPALGNVKS